MMTENNKKLRMNTLCNYSTSDASMAVNCVMTADDVFDQLKCIHPFSNNNKRVLSKRQIELLLEYRDKTKESKEELSRCRNEMKAISEIVQLRIDGTEESLEKLTKFARTAKASNITSQVYTNSLLLAMHKMAVRDTLDKVKGIPKIAEMQIPGDHPRFYNIMEDIKKKKGISLNKELQSATKLWLWVKKQNKKTTKLKPVPEESHGGVPAGPPSPSKTPHPCKNSGITKSPRTAKPVASPRDPKTPATAKLAAQTKSGTKVALTSTAENPADTASKSRRQSVGQQTDSIPNSPVTKEQKQCRNLSDIGIEQAAEESKLIDSPAADPKSSELPVEPSSLLNQKYCLKCEQRSEMTSSQATATEPTEAANQIDRHSVGQQTDMPTSPVAKEHRHSQTSLELNSSTSSKPTNYSCTPSPENEVFPLILPSTSPPRWSPSSCTRCVLCHYHGNKRHSQSDAEQMVKLLNIEDRTSSGYRRQLSVISQSSHCEENVETGNEGSKLDNIEPSNLASHVRTGSSIRSSPLSQYPPAKRSIQRCQSAPVMRIPMREKKVTISANLRLDHELMSRRKKVETCERGINAQSRLCTPERKPVTIVMEVNTQTEDIRNPEYMDPRDLFLNAEDVADEIGDESTTFSQVNGFRQEAERQYSANSVESLMWIIARELNSNQWKDLYEKLLYYSGQIFPGSVISEHIQTIVSQNQEEVMCAVAALRKWKEINGKLSTRILRKSLKTIHRNDIAYSVDKFIDRQNYYLNKAL